jgi:hypothetical protein
MSRLPMAAEALLRAMLSGSADRLLAALHRDATVNVGERAYRKGCLRRWAEEFISRAPLDIRIMSRGGTREEPELTVQIYRASAVEGPFTWSLRIADERILQLSTAESHGPNMPAVVERFLDAVSHGDVISLIQCFTDDAVVNDELVEYLGSERIRAWSERHVIGRRLALHAVSCVTSRERAIVTVHATGEFDVGGLPDPLVLTLYSSLMDDRITQLIILQNLEHESFD